MKREIRGEAGVRNRVKGIVRVGVEVRVGRMVRGKLRLLC